MDSPVHLALVTAVQVRNSVNAHCTYEVTAFLKHNKRKNSQVYFVCEPADPVLQAGDSEEPQRELPGWHAGGYLTRTNQVSGTTHSYIATWEACWRISYQD